MQNRLFVMAAALIIVCSPVLTLSIQSQPQSGEVALVIAAPWGTEAAQIAAMAGVQEVAPERAPLGALVMLDTAHSLDRLYEHGALLVINGEKVLELCTT